VTASSTTCVYSTPDLLQCWGAIDGSKQRVGLTMAGVTSFAQLSMGQDRACELTLSGDVLCWGAKFSDGATPIAGLGEVVGMSTGGGQHTCAVLSDGRAKCWGANESGQLGDGTKMPRTGPVEVGLSGIVQMSVGSQFSCALLNTGEVRCWGDNSYAELGDGSNHDSLAPVTPSNLPADVVRIVSGPNHTCALSSLGSVRCWGSNGYGQLGKVDAGAGAPVIAELPGPVRDLAVGSYHTCAILSDDKVTCWGQNNKGQIGTTVSNSELPHSLDFGPEKPMQISAGAAHSCVRLLSGKVKCWGWNFSGQLGNNDTADSAVPVDVVL
jgi:alpha-tubulin suppressor-like RCC1 family protein